MGFLQKRGLIALATSPGDSEVTVVVGDETLGADDKLLAQLLAAATAGALPAGPAYKRAPIRLAKSGDAPKPKGRLCAEQLGFNLHAATHVPGNDKQGREHLRRYILRKPFANHRLHTLPDGKVQLDFKGLGLTAPKLFCLPLMPSSRALPPSFRLQGVTTLATSA